MDTVRARASKQPQTRRSASLRNRLLVISILLALVPVLITGITAGVISAQGLTDLVYNELSAVAALKESQVNSWLITLQTNLDLISANTANRRNVTNILQGEASSALLARTRAEFRINQERAGYFEELFVLDRDGRIVLSTNEVQEGKIQTTQRYFVEGLKGRYISPPAYEVSLGTASILVAQPIFDSAGQLQGVLAGRANLSALNEIMSERTGLGETGETYLVSANYAVLTSLRLLDVVPGQTYVRSDGLNAVIGSRANGQNTYLDYADTSVLGVYRWLPNLQAALIAEQDSSEALASVNTEIQFIVVLMSITGLVAVVIAFLVTQSIAGPISALAVVAGQISQGNFDQKAVATSQDEIGTLAEAFNAMTSRLREFIGTLEQRVADRTRALAVSGEISRSLSTILSQEKLVSEVVEQLRKGFNYYHAHIYLLSDDGQTLVMAGGTGDAGKMLLDRGHAIMVGRGLVGRAAETREIVLVPDTRKDPEWLPNPLLPDTRAEIAVPIVIGDQLMGVLDVQNDTANSLGEQDADVIGAVANQAAVALQNIRQIAGTQKIANDLSVVANVGIATSTITDINVLLQEVVDLSKKSFGLYHAHIYLLNDAGDTLVLTAGAGEVGRQMVSEGRSIPLDREQSLVARAARTQAGVVVNDVRADADFLPNPLLPDTRSEMAVPMIVGGKVMGVLDVQADIVGRFTQVDVDIKTTLASQVAVALQNARSFAQARLQAEREAALNAITQKIQGTTSMEEALKITARELGQILGRKPTLVTLQRPDAPEKEASSEVDPGVTR